MSTTPRTDEQVLAYLTEDGSELVHASTARELETKLAAMKADFEKLALSAAQAADRNVELRCLAEKAEAALFAERKNARMLTNNLKDLIRELETELVAAKLEADGEARWAFEYLARAEKAEAELAKRDSEYLRGTKMVVESASVWQTRAEKAEAKIITARSALSRIANSDYRGNRSTESQIAFAALEEIK